MLASAIIDRARLVLNDIDAVRWLDPEMLKWLGDGLRAIALVRPDSCAVNNVLTLVAGTRQSLPTDTGNVGLRLLDVVRNVSSVGPPVVGGRSIRYVDRDVLDSQNNQWHLQAQAGTITNYVYDNRDPKHFYVYPPAINATKIEAVYSKNPTDPASTGATLDIDDIYADPLLNYVLHRCYSKDAEFTYNLQLSGAYLQIFNGLLGIKTKIDVSFSPDLNSKGASPSVAAIQAGGV